MRRTSILLGVTAAVVLVACACAPPENGAQAPPAAGGASGSPQKGPTGDSIVAWVKDYGPLGGGGSHHEAAYVQLSHDQCQGALTMADSTDTETGSPMAQPLKWLYGGAGAACLAALHGQGQMWARAMRDYDRAKANPIGYTCGDVEVLRMLEALVTAHRAGITSFLKGPGSGKSACPRLREVRPNHGPRAGGYEVELIGENLPIEPFYVDWCGDVLRTRSSNGRSAKVKVPADDGCGSMRPDVTDSVPVRGEATFEYDAR